LVSRGGDQTIDTRNDTIIKKNQESVLTMNKAPDRRNLLKILNDIQKMKHKKTPHNPTSTINIGGFTKKSKFTLQDIKDAQTYLIKKH
jgi:hypothetical protein